YAGNPNNNNGWLAADDYLLGELEAMVGEQMVVPAIKEVSEPVAEAEEEQAIALMADMEEGHMDEVNEEWLMAPITPPLVLAVQPPNVYKVGGPSTAVSNAEVAASVTVEELGPRVYAVEEHVQVMVSQMAHAAGRWEQVSAQVEQGQQTVAQRDKTISKLTQQVQALQIDMQHRDTQIQQLQTTVTEMGRRESTLMRCILGLERRIAALEKRPPRPQ
nr:hypothetical protein [Tanacetum cinerariifolium]